MRLFFGGGGRVFYYGLIFCIWTRGDVISTSLKRVSVLLKEDTIAICQFIHVFLVQLLLFSGFFIQTPTTIPPWKPPFVYLIMNNFPSCYPLRFPYFRTPFYSAPRCCSQLSWYFGWVEWFTVYISVFWSPIIPDFNHFVGCICNLDIERIQRWLWQGTCFVCLGSLFYLYRSWTGL